MIESERVTKLVSGNAMKIDDTGFECTTIRIPLVSDVEDRICLFEDGFAVVYQRYCERAGAELLAKDRIGKKGRHLVIVLSRRDRRMRYPRELHMVAGENVVPGI